MCRILQSGFPCSYRRQDVRLGVGTYDRGSLFPGARKRWCVLRDFADPDKNYLRLLLVEPSSRFILARRDGLSWRLPRVAIPRWSRIAANLLAELKQQFGIQAIVLDELEAPSCDSLVLAEVIACRQPMGDGLFAWCTLGDLAADEFLESEFKIVQNLLLNGATGRGQFSRLGWIREVLAWVAVHFEVNPNEFVDITQLNASSNSTLIRLQRAKGPAVWFKSVDDSEMSEYRITVALISQFPDYLPTLLGTHVGWHAWLMEDAGRPLDEIDNVRPRVFEEVAHHLAELQKASACAIPSLLKQGCADLRISVLRSRMPEVMTDLEEAVETPDFGRYSYLRRARIQELHQIFEEAAAQLEAVGVPDTLVHGDINVGNILIADGSCVFTDWAQAGIGNPLANFEQLRIQVAQHRDAPVIHHRLLAAYMRAWSTQLTPSQIRSAFAAAPPIAIAMYIQNRRDWFNRERLQEPHFVRYARSMARQMDRAVREFQSRAALTA